MFKILKDIHGTSWSQWTYVWPAAAAVVLCVCVYGRALHAPFVWDDRIYIEENAALSSPISLKTFVSEEYFKVSKEETWRPAATGVYSLLSKGWGRRPGPMRLASLLLHFLNAFLLFFLLRELRSPPALSVLAAGLFLIHPAHTETLVCVSFNEELLAGAGILAMLVAHLRGKYLWAAAGLMFAALSKETGVLGMVLVVLLDFSQGGTAQVRQRWREYLLYSVAAAVYVWLRFVQLPGQAAGLAETLPLGERVLYALEGVVSAVRIFLIPVRLRIEYFALPVLSLREGLAWCGGAGLIAAIAAWPKLREDRRLLFFCIWPMVFLAATSNILPVGVLSLRYMAERWLYIPFMGLAVVCAHLLYKRGGIILLLLMLWGHLAGYRLADWRSEPRLWSSLVEIYPWSAKALEGLGEAHYRAGAYTAAQKAFARALAMREGRTDRVLAHYVERSAGVLRWDSASLYRWHGRTALKLNNISAAEDAFTHAVELQPADAYSYRRMAYHYAEAGAWAHAERWIAQGLRHRGSDTVLLRLKKDAARRHLSFEAGFD